MMKLLITYDTNERRQLSETSYQYIQEEVELEPIKIIRQPCGAGAAANRFHYGAYFAAPDDAAFPYRGMIHSPINRKTNPHFNPKKLNWVGNVAQLQPSS